MTEDLTNLIDGSRTTFETKEPFFAGTAHVYVDGIRATAGYDYTETVAGELGSGFVTTSPVPLGSRLVVVYENLASGVVTASGS